MLRKRETVFPAQALNDPVIILNSVGWALMAQHGFEWWVRNGFGIDNKKIRLGIHVENFYRWARRPNLPGIITKLFPLSNASTTFTSGARQQHFYFCVTKHNLAFRCVVQCPRDYEELFLK